MKLIYVAGPYRASTTWKVEQNIRHAEEVAAVVNSECNLHANVAMAVCPHTMNRFFEGAGPDSLWLPGTMELFRRCDAIIMVRGWEGSSGAQAECAEATRLEMPVFFADEAGWGPSFSLAWREYMRAQAE